jgi:hypothetical protein
MRLTETTTFTVTASRPPCPDATDEVVITVSDSLWLLPPGLPAFDHNSPYTQELTSNAIEPYYSIVPGSGELPSGIVLHSNGMITGTSSFEHDGGSRTFTVKVEGIDGCTISKTYSIYGNLYVIVYM